MQEPRGGQIVTYACPVAKPEYTPPELQGKSLSSTVRSPEQDAFGLGVLIFQLLMEGNHPFRAQWLGKGDPPPVEERIALGGFPYTSTPGMPVRPPKYAPDLDLLHPEISELVRRCFIDGHGDPRLRPDASAWEKAISEAEKSLVQCPNHHYYSEHLRGCPICHAQRAPAGGSAWPTSQARRPAASSRTAGPSVPAGQQAASPGTKPFTPPPAGKPASQQAPTTGGQTRTGWRKASRTAARPGNAAAAGSPPQPPPGSTTSGPSGPGSGYASPGAQTANASGAKHQPGGAASSARPAGPAASGQSPAGPAGGVTSGFKQAVQVWETFKFWQAQQAQVQQTGPGSGLWGSRQAQQATAAWNTWKFWQAKQAQQPSQAPPPAAQSAQPPPGRPAAQAQPAPGSPGATQSTNSAAPSAGAGSAQQTSAARRSGCTDPSKYSRGGNRAAAPTTTSTFPAHTPWLLEAVKNFCTVNAEPIGSGPAESAPSITTCSPTVAASTTSSWNQTGRLSALSTAQARPAICKHPTWRTGLLAACASSSTAGKQPIKLGWAAVV